VRYVVVFDPGILSKFQDDGAIFRGLGSTFSFTDTTVGFDADMKGLGRLFHM
jgi:hypothetical protein